MAAFLFINRTLFEFSSDLCYVLSKRERGVNYETIWTEPEYALSQ